MKKRKHKKRNKLFNPVHFATITAGFRTLRTPTKKEKLERINKKYKKYED